MIRIAVMDDQEEDRQKLCHMLENYMQKIKEEYALVPYKSPMDLLTDLDYGGYFDLFFLDVDMPKTSGLAVGTEIRKKYADAVIVYVTNFVEYSPSAFEVDAFRYILKAELEEKLPKALDAVLARLEKREGKSYIVKHYLDVETIPFRDIYYLQKEGKYVMLHHKNGTLDIRKSLETVLRELNSTDFVKIGRGTAVNIRHIRLTEGEKVVLSNGECLQMNRYDSSNIKKRILECLTAKQ